MKPIKLKINQRIYDDMDNRFGTILLIDHKDNDRNLEKDDDEIVILYRPDDSNGECETFAENVHPVEKKAYLVTFAPMTRVVVEVPSDESIDEESLNDMIAQAAINKIVYNPVEYITHENWDEIREDTEVPAEPGECLVEVDWETDGEHTDLPNVVSIPNNVIEDDDVADWLSDNYGFLVNSWRKA